MYDGHNVFAKIIRGELPAEFLYQDDKLIIIKDINPCAPVHALAIPKGEYETFDDFISRAGEAEVYNFFKTINTVVQELGLTALGYRLVANNGINGGQEIGHFHLHIIGGRKLTGILG